MRLEPDNASFGYLYAAVLKAQDARKAETFLVNLLADPSRRHERAELYLLVQSLTDRGDRREITAYLPELRALAASDVQARALLDQLL